MTYDFQHSCQNPQGAQPLLLLYTPDLDSPDMGFLGYAHFSKPATSGIRFLGYACFSRASPPPLASFVLLVEPQHGLCTVGILSVHRGRLKRAGWISVLDSLARLPSSGVCQECTRKTTWANPTRPRAEMARDSSDMHTF